MYGARTTPSISQKGFAMRSSHFVTLLAGVATAGLAGFAAAHHSQVGIFDSKENIEVTGVIKTISWRNPHGQILLTETNADGTTTEWDAETASIAVLGIPSNQDSQHLLRNQ
jgi:hypothetical protein